MERMRLPLNDPRAIDLLAAWGAPYSWGGGIPRHGNTAWPDGPRGLAGGIGWDCSGFAQACMVRLNLLAPFAPDRTAAMLSDICQPVTAGTEKIGDLVFYGTPRVTHVMVYLGPGVVLGATSGGKATNGDDPRAFVSLERLHYRADLQGIKRLLNPMIGMAVA